MRRAVVFAMLALLACSCRTAKVVERPVYIHDTSVVSSVRLDSVYVDRWHVECRDGDTVRIRDSVLVYRYVLRTDTAYRVVERPVTVRETVEVARPLTWWQRTQKTGFWVLLAAVAGYVCLRLYRLGLF